MKCTDCENWKPIGTHAKQQVENMQCPVCGYYCTGNGGVGCIDKKGLYEKLHAKPEEPKPCSKVTVWAEYRNHSIDNDYIIWENCCLNRSYAKGHFSFTGTPNIPEIVENTLGKGALAVEIECDKPFIYGNGVYCVLCDKRIGKMNLDAWVDKYGYNFWWQTVCEDTYLTSSRIEQAITEYLSKKEEIKAGEIAMWYADREGALPVMIKDCNHISGAPLCSTIDGRIINVLKPNLCKATHEEVLKYFTVEVDGVRFVLYEDRVGDVKVVMNGYWEWFEGGKARSFIKAIAKQNGWNIMPNVWRKKLFGDVFPSPRKGE